MTKTNRENSWFRPAMVASLTLLTGATHPTLSVASTTASHSFPKVDCDRIYQAPGHGKSFYEQNPTYFDSRVVTGALPRATPEKHGLDAEHLQKGVAQLRESSRVLSVIVVKSGDMILEEYFNGSGSNHSNNIHSASKSILSTLVGIAIDRGDIESVDQRLSEFLPEYFSETDDELRRSLTIRHLLTMSSGLAWSHDPVRGTEIEIQEKPDWVAAILSLPIIDPPGEQFFYNTGLTHLMSAVISRATGMSTCEFAHTYLLEPIGITAEHWGRDPQGVYSGGYNFYITPREMATFGQLILDGGRHKDRQLVRPEWIRDSVRTYFGPRRDDEANNYWWHSGRRGYGFNWWLIRAEGHVMVTAWGWGGQMIYIIPDLDTVVVLTQDTSDAGAVAEDPVNHDFVKKFILQ